MGEETANGRPVERRFRIRRPAWVAFAALALGVIVDRYFDPDLSVWLTFCVASLYSTCDSLSSQSPRLATVALICLLVGLGGARHHVAWSTASSNDIAALAADEPQLIRLRGYAIEPPEIQQAQHAATIPVWMQLDQSEFPLRCEAVFDRGAWRTVSGIIEVEVSGHLLDVRAGQQVTVTGELSLPAPPRNPGERDYREYLRSRQLSARLLVDHPLSVQPHEKLSSPWWSLMRTRDDLRAAGEKLIRQHLSPPTQPLASALLLGDRTRMDEELRSDFANSGTMHLLAISGLHVAILIGLVFVLCRLLNLSPLATALALFFSAVGYALMTDVRPPVLRAVVLTTLMLLGQIRFRNVSSMNSLCATALVLLLWHPADLFDVGAQLSFLAVWAIIVSSRWATRLTRPTTTPVLEQSRWWRTRLFAAGRGLMRLYIATGAIWIATLPVVIRAFHLISPVGILINVLVIPYSSVILVTGFIFLMGGLLVPDLAFWLAQPFDWSLSLLIWFIDLSAATPAGHVHIPDLPIWWAVGFYVLLGTWWGLWGRGQHAAWGGRGLLCWSILGMCLLLFPQARSGMRCTFIAVGHGNAVLLELPQGTNLLYDAGTLGQGSAAARAVERVMWSRQIDRIDTIVVSHADVDHFNGVGQLLRDVPVGSVICSRSFLDFEQDAVVDLCETALANGVPIRFCQTGDELYGMTASESVQISVVHPAADFRSGNDNANSVVLDIEYAGKRILLTGDIEGEGLVRLLEEISGNVDVLMSPHHGSKSSNPRGLFDWANSERVVISTNDLAARNRIADIAEAAQVYSTANGGAITVTIKPDGEISLSEFRTTK